MRLMTTRGRGEPVVMVHGLWLTGWAMGYIAWRLRRCGFRPYLFSYPSVRHPLRENATALRRFSDAIPGDVVHFVGHSLGGVVIQTMMACCPPPRPGRIVTICSPHRGSRVARVLSQWSLGRRILGASMAELLNSEAPSNQTCTREVGLIKGDLPIGTGRLVPGLKRPNDGVVAVEEMSWPGASDEIMLRQMHTGMLCSTSAAEAVSEFLQHGRFTESRSVS